MLALVSGVIGLGLMVSWIVGLSMGATFWLTWLNGAAAALAFAACGLLPGQRAALPAGALLGLIAGGLLLLWLIAIATHATGWLTWSTFAIALTAGPVALGAAFQGVLGEPPPRNAE